jgi:hypothetical protein
MPTFSVFAVARTGCTEVKTTSKHWPCLFPQHGPGRKHERTIELEPWQQAVRRPLKDGDRWYECPRYLLVNKSADIHRLCGKAQDLLRVAWRLAKPTTISVARREAVARLDEFVGPKYRPVP